MDDNNNTGSQNPTEAPEVPKAPEAPEAPRAPRAQKHEQVFLRPGDHCYPQAEPGNPNVPRDLFPPTPPAPGGRS